MSSFIFFGSGTCIVDGVDIHGGYIRVMLMVLMTFFLQVLGRQAKRSMPMPVEEWPYPVTQT